MGHPGSRTAQCSLWNRYLGNPGSIKTAFPTRPMRGNPLVNHTAKETGLVCTNCGNSFLLHADPHLSGGGPYDIN